MGYDPTARKWTLVMPASPQPTRRCGRCHRVRNTLAIHRTFDNQHWCVDCIRGDQPARR